MSGQIEDHDRGLAHDLEVIGRRMIARRRMLAWFATAGAGALVSGCGGGSGSGTETASAAATTTTAGTTTTTATTTTTSSSSACVVDPTETNGPYPADGTNTSSGSTSNVLTSSGVVRSDIRASFIGSTAAAVGVPLTLTLTLVNAGASCAPLAGYAIYIWCCDAAGKYSLYTVPAESYLRGVQVTDAAGQVTFTLIYPGCYDGRWPHIHFEVYASQSMATSGRAAKLISQLAMPSDISGTVYSSASSFYPSSYANFARVTLSSDNVFGDNSWAQIQQQTPAMTGSVAAGYAATATIGISV